MEEPTTKPKISAKDFFLNLGATVALYTVVVSLVSLLFRVIDAAFPRVVDGYFGSTSISWPVATLVIFFPIFIALMWLLGKQYEVEPDRRYTGIHKWLTYITLFLAGAAMAVDLITILYYFLDGQELAAGFVLKVIALFIIASTIFAYYISDITGRLTSGMRKLWRVVSSVVIVGAIIWGFTVLGSPQTQRLLKYDQQKVNDLLNINNGVTNYYSINGKLPESVSELSRDFYINLNDPQIKKPYEYQKTGNTTYNLCAEFNKPSPENRSMAYPYMYGERSWVHPAGRYCFSQTINPNLYQKPFPVR